MVAQTATVALTRRRMPAICTEAALSGPRVHSTRCVYLRSECAGCRSSSHAAKTFCCCPLVGRCDISVACGHKRRARQGTRFREKRKQQETDGGCGHMSSSKVRLLPNHIAVTLPALAMISSLTPRAILVDASMHACACVFFSHRSFFGSANAPRSLPAAQEVQQDAGGGSVQEAHVPQVRLSRHRP